MIINFKETWVYDWQELVGSILGASLPLLIWFFTQWYSKYEKHRNDLVFLETQTVSCINNLLESRETLHAFVNTRIPKMLSEVEELSRQGVYCVNRVYLPDFYVTTLSEVIFKLNVKSGYLINKVLKAYILSKDHSVQLADIRQQYIETLNIQKEMSVLRLNSAEVQNEIYKSNLSHFSEIINEKVVGNNYNVYLKILVEIMLVTRWIREKHLWRWKLKFEAHFKYFKSWQEFTHYKLTTHQRIHQHFESLVQKEIVGIENQFSQIKNKL